MLLIALSNITKNRFCHLRPPVRLGQTSHSTPRLCMGNIYVSDMKIVHKSVFWA